MKVPDCIQCVCIDYRKLFETDQAMGDALRVDVGIARDMVKGEIYPSLDLMIKI